VNSLRNPLNSNENLTVTPVFRGKEETSGGREKEKCEEEGEKNPRIR
jgi:hypothetical protein